MSNFYGGYGAPVRVFPPVSPVGGGAIGGAGVSSPGSLGGAAAGGAVFSLGVVVGGAIGQAIAPNPTQGSTQLAVNSVGQASNAVNQAVNNVAIGVIDIQQVSQGNDGGRPRSQSLPRESRVGARLETMRTTFNQNNQEALLILRGTHNANHRGYGLVHFITQHPDVFNAMGFTEVQLNQAVNGDNPLLVRMANRLAAVVSQTPHGITVKGKLVYQLDNNRYMSIGISNEPWADVGNRHVIIQINLINENSILTGPGKNGLHIRVTGY